MAILESLLPMKKSAGSLTFKRRKSDGRVIVSQKIETFHNHRTTRSMQNKLPMINTQAMYRFLKNQVRENMEPDGSKRSAYSTYLHLNKPLTRSWLPQQEAHNGNAILEPHYISNGTLMPVLCQLDGDNKMLTDILSGLNSFEGVTVGEWSRDLLEHNADYQSGDLLRLVYLRQVSRQYDTQRWVSHRIEDQSRLVMLNENDDRLLSEVVDTELWGLLDGHLALLQPLSSAAATVVRLRPQVRDAGTSGMLVYNTLAQHLAAGFPLATYVKPDAQPMICKVSRQRLVCVNPLIEDYATDERFAEAARTFGPIKDPA